MLACPPCTHARTHTNVQLERVSRDAQALAAAVRDCLTELQQCALRLRRLRETQVREASWAAQCMQAAQAGAGSARGDGGGNGDGDGNGDGSGVDGAARGRSAGEQAVA